MSLANPIHDNNLLKEMRAGNAAAFQTLYRQHQAPLYRYALLRSASEAMAADVVQDVFMGLLADAYKFDPLRGSLQSFLFGVARNLILKREEAGRRYVSTSASSGSEDDDDVECEWMDEAAADEQEPSQRLFASQVAEQVRRALAALAPHYRDVVVLYEMHDMSYLEIAQICQIDIGTVRSRLSRARAALLTRLKHLEPDTAAASSAR
ncbi:RNA polymerase sigma factor [Undibacterium sp.]|uniref:RNA polymerase sigma factor n=1 Tax=Undibacterium sp. TaxID=1914977 RepID=UPI00374DFB2F